LGLSESQDFAIKSSATSPLSRWAIASIAVASALGASMLGRSASQSVTPSGCTSIQNVPVTYSITYGAAVQGLFDNFLTNGGTEGCVDCHTAPPSAGGLDLTDGVSWSNLINVSSATDASLKYVVPNHPEQSLLFQKINCDTPAIGHRMPLVGGPLSPEQQALIYDWIAGGAPATTTNTLFRDGFDIRGFDQ
jgi:hypothetical protein